MKKRGRSFPSAKVVVTGKKAPPLKKDTLFLRNRLELVISPSSSLGGVEIAKRKV